MWWIIWAVLIVAGAALLALLCWRVWTKAKALSALTREAGELGTRLDEAMLAVATPGSRHRRPGPLGHPETIAEAHDLRDRVAAERELGRRRRLERATTRWRDLKIIS